MESTSSPSFSPSAPSPSASSLSPSSPAASSPSASSLSVSSPAGCAGPHPAVTAAGPWYGLDIETDTSIDGLDPARSRIIAVALCDPGNVELVLDGDERSILTDLDAALAASDPGVLVTWNGAAFDLPFIEDRARTLGIEIGLELRFDPAIPRRDPIPGHDGAYRARWYHHRHIDGYQLFRADVGASMRLPCGLKPLARFVGLPVIEVDRATIHELDAEITRRYVASDAYLARALVLRRAPTALAAVDPVR